MEVSTKLFNAQATKNFGKINEQIQDTQAKIASGRSFLKASDDPVTASNLSAKREQKILLERFIKNGNTAKTRLDLADSGLNQVINVLTRFSELSIQAANDTNGVASPTKPRRHLSRWSVWRQGLGIRPKYCFNDISSQTRS